LLQFAYGVHTSQILGGPNWIKTDRFDISADPEMERRPSASELKTMTARLLMERFHLVLANEEAVLPVFALVRTKARLPIPLAFCQEGSFLREVCSYITEP
jgi:uncharacterized protein (TIGR03435 family)